ncbi:MAG: hypothetical protein U9Q74_08645 [Gemmatimonadota bacterium]|nr:hypothetical protein [Gemmatimonadota bacterium]
MLPSLFPAAARPGRAERHAGRAALATLIAATSLTAVACDEGGGPRQEDPNAFAWNGTVAAPGVVRIRNTIGPITVSPSADGQVHVRAAVSWSKGDPKKDIRYDVVPEANAVTVCAIWGSGNCSATGYNSGKKNDGISINLNNHTNARVSFAVEVPAGLRVDAWTLTGDVTVRAAAPVVARAIDGDIKVGTSVGPVTGETLNGDVDIRMTTIGDTGAVRAESKNGDAVAYVPEIRDGVIAASTLNGKIGSDFGDFGTTRDGINKRFDWTLGAGTRRYEVSSLNGSAYLRLINPDGTVGPAPAGQAASGADRPSSGTKAARKQPR